MLYITAYNLERNNLEPSATCVKFYFDICPFTWVFFFIYLVVSGGKSYVTIQGERKRIAT